MAGITKKKGFTPTQTAPADNNYVIARGTTATCCQDWVIRLQILSLKLGTSDETVRWTDIFH
jgi:hypothetical protein